MASEGDSETVHTKQRETLSLLRNPATGNSPILEDDVMTDPITEEQFEFDGQKWTAVQDYDD